MKLVAWEAALAAAIVIGLLMMQDCAGAAACSKACGPAGVRSFEMQDNGCRDNTPICVCNPPSAPPAVFRDVVSL